MASSHEFPFAVSLQYSSTGSASNRQHLCGGALIGANYVLTAAHCFYDNNGNLDSASNWVVVAGSSNNNVCANSGWVKSSSCNYAQVKTINVHPSYNSRTVKNDIAILELSTSITIDGTNTKIAYIESGSVPVNSNFNVLVAGWGYYSTSEVVSTALRKVVIPVVQPSVCNALSLAMSSPMQVCAGYDSHDACSGDSGGPLFRSLNNSTSDWALIGIVSYGPDTVCGADATTRGVYTNTTYFLNSFIKPLVSSVKLSAYDPSGTYFTNSIGVTASVNVIVLVASLLILL